MILKLFCSDKKKYCFIN